MPRTYNNCHFCGGEVSEKKITVDYMWGGKLISLVDNVPAGVCEVCGEQYFKAEIVKELERIALSDEEPKAVIQVPLREMAVA